MIPRLSTKRTKKIKLGSGPGETQEWLPEDLHYGLTIDNEHFGFKRLYDLNIFILRCVYRLTQEERNRLYAIRNEVEKAGTR